MSIEQKHEIEDPSVKLDDEDKVEEDGWTAYDEGKEQEYKKACDNFKKAVCDKQDAWERFVKVRDDPQAKLKHERKVAAKVKEAQEKNEDLKSTEIDWWSVISKMPEYLELGKFDERVGEAADAVRDAVMERRSSWQTESDARRQGGYTIYELQQQAYKDYNEKKFGGKDR